LSVWSDHTTIKQQNQKEDGLRKCATSNLAMSKSKGESNMKNYRFFIMGMIVFMTVINYVDRGAISYAQKDIIDAFGFDSVAWGAVLGYFGYG
jgi:sugar phosphate permease